MKRYLITYLILLFIVGCKENRADKIMAKAELEMQETRMSSKVELTHVNGKYQLWVNKEPFYIKGAGLEFGEITSLAKHKANSFRTWIS